MSERTLPHDLEAERATLGAILVDGDTNCPIAREVIQPADFFRRAHAIIYEAMVALEDRRERIDLVTVSAEVQRTEGDLATVGGPAYLSQMTDGVPRASNVRHYAALVREHSKRRALIRMANELIVKAYDAEDPTMQLLAEADARMLKIVRGRESGRMVDLRSTVHEMVRDIEYRVQHKGTLTGVTTGFKSIDDQTLGWQRGEMVIVAARPSMGKTAFVLNTAAAAARAGHHVAIFSLEMRRNQLEQRILAHVAGVELSHIRNGFLGEDELERLGAGMGEVSKLPIHVDDSAYQTVSSIRAACRRLRSEHGLGLVVVDYIQLMQAGDSRRNTTRNEELAQISRALKVMADEVDAPFLVLSQLSRAKAGQNAPPTLADLRDSGALEQDADTVAFLHRKTHRASGKTAFIFEKQRNGETGTIVLSIDRATQTFTDEGEEPEPVEAPPDDAPKGRRNRR